MNISKRHPRENSVHRFLITFLLFVLTLGSMLFTGSRAQAQEDGELWETPFNLSQSGAAGEPRIVVDSDGVYHVLWREDAVNSFFYAVREGARWRNILPPELPFATRRYVEDEVLVADAPTPLYDPQLMADDDGQIHAFWSDGKNNLFHSSVPAGEFTTYESWTERQLLSESALGFSAATDNANKAHLAYVSSGEGIEAPAGVYYRSLADNGDAWSEPDPIYKSAYYRAADPAGVNIQLELGKSPGNSSGVHVVVDNRPLEEILYVNSSNSGQTWKTPSIVDRRRSDDPALSMGPSNIEILSSGGNLHLMWLAGHDLECQLYHQWSEDDGRNWRPAVVLESEDGICPSEFGLKSGADGQLFILANTNGGAFIQTWNGEEWSKPEKQGVLTAFADPATHRLVNLGCQQMNLGENNDLFVAGCGSTEGKQDIWLLERSLGVEEDWFLTEPTTWSEPTTLMSSVDDLSDPLIVPGSDNLLHAFWIENGTDLSVEDTNAKIYYSSWNEDVWSRQLPLLELGSVQADQLSGVFDPDVGPFLMWRDRETNTHFSSHASGDRMLLPADWSTPTPLFDPEEIVGHALPYLGRDGLVYVIYARPLNEERGIYLKRSADFGKNWSESMGVFDAVAANTPMVDQPSIAQTENGDLHVTFTAYSLEPEPVATDLYYTRSDDYGETWSDAELIAQGDIGRSQVVGIDGQTVLLAWQQKDGEQAQLWSQHSADGGGRWERATLLLDPSELPAAFSLITHLPDQPYLVQLQANEFGELALQERRWRESAWQAIESHDLESNLNNEKLLDLTAAVTGHGHLIGLFNTEPMMEEETSDDSGFTVVRQLGIQQLEGTQFTSQLPSSKLYFLNRSIELAVPAGASGGAVTESSSVPELAPAPAEEPVPSSDLAPVENSDSAEIELGETGDIGESLSTVNGLLMGVVPALLIIIVVFAAGIIRLRPR